MKKTATLKSPGHDLTEEELEALLNKKRSDNAKKRKKQKETYENNRNEAVTEIETTARLIHNQLLQFKTACHEVMAKQEIALQEYGLKNKRSKGGFSITNQDATFKVVRRRDTNPVWDERSDKGCALIREFLDDKVKKVAKPEYEIIMGFIERNKQGDLEYGKVMDLLKHKDNYQDERWQKGCELVLEGYNIHMKGYGYEFKFKDDQGKWETLSLNFSSIGSA